jgi:hypothetical protein
MESAHGSQKIKKPTILNRGVSQETHQLFEIF